MNKPSESDLGGRKALISGGSSGIGKAIAEALRSKGVLTTIADVSEPEPETFHQFFPCDVTAGPDVDRLYNVLQQGEGLPEILVCCAGRGISEKLTEGDPEKWKQVLELNVLGALRLFRAFVPHMLEQGIGDVVVVSSVAAGKAFEYGGIYAASKAALETVAETLRLEVLPKVRVITVAPGVTDTRFFTNEISGFNSAEKIGYGALPPEEVAQAVVYALTRPRDVAVNHLMLRPSLQPF